MRRPGRNDPCYCGRDQKYKKCCLAKDEADARAEVVVPVAESDGGLTLLIETSAGTFVRRIPSASPLAPEVSEGEAAEVATHNAAAVWGMPDFMFRNAKRRTASGIRELGDGIVRVGDLGVVLQVKRRSGTPADPIRERSWIAKNVGKAIRQANGTVSSLRRESALLENRRGRALEIDGNALQWIACVVVDHPAVPSEAVPDLDGSAQPTVVLLRRDWEFLFNQLKSTQAVCEYLQRVAGRPLSLGDEPARYYELASADADAQPDPIDEAFLQGNARTVSEPLLPLVPIPTSTPAHKLVRWIMEDVATTPIEPHAGSEDARLRVLAEIDRVPGAQRGAIGAFLLESLEELASAPRNEVVWKVRSYRGGRGLIHLGFAVCSQGSEMHRDFFTTWVHLRHFELRAATGADLTTVGILLTLRQDGQRDWDTTLSAVHGEVRFAEEELAELRQYWPIGGGRPTALADSGVQ